MAWWGDVTDDLVWTGWLGGGRGCGAWPPDGRLAPLLEGAEGCVEGGVAEVVGVPVGARPGAVALWWVDSWIHELPVDVAVVDGADLVQVEDRAADGVAGAKQVPPRPGRAAEGWLGGCRPMGRQDLPDPVEGLWAEEGREPAAVQSLQGAAIGEQSDASVLGRVQLQDQGRRDDAALAMGRKHDEVGVAGSEPLQATEQVGHDPLGVAGWASGWVARSQKVPRSQRIPTVRRRLGLR